MEKQGSGRPRKFLDCDRAMYWYNMGLNDREISEKCGVGRKTVAAWRAKKMLPTKAQKRAKKDTMSLLKWDSVQARKHGVTYGEWVSPAFKAERERLLKEKYLL